MSDQVPIRFINEDPRPDQWYAGDPSELPDSEPTRGVSAAPNRHIRSTKDRAPRPGRVRRTVKTIGYVAAAGVLAAGVLQIKDWVTGFNPKTQHKVELEVGAPRTKVYSDVHLDLAGIDSTFALTLKTSLDRPGPFNCDTETQHTGKKGQDPKITTHTDAGLVVDSLRVTRDGSRVVATVEGDLRLGRSSVNYDQQMINVEGASGGVDVCVGTHEITAARNIIDRTVQHAGGIAAACALEDEAGERAVRLGLAQFVANTDLANGTPAEAIDVEIPDYDRSAQAVYGEQVSSFELSVSGVIDNYLRETSDHADPKINEGALLDCGQHQITFER